MGMKRRFFIFSLPRSGSSWLSVFLSGPGSYCYHEPFADGDNVEAKWAGRPEECVGAIDTSAHKRGMYPVCSAYFVLRRHKHEISSSLKLKGWVLNLDTELDALDSIATTFQCLPIYYRWLIEVSYLETIWNSVTGGLPFDRERAEYLSEMNIQRKFANVVARTHRNAEREVQHSAAP
jgi:hypothetical protein